MLTCVQAGMAQTGPLATRGTEFWVGFMQNAYAAQTLKLQIAAQANVTGTVSMPLLGWNEAFSVNANGTATVIVPANAEHIGSETVSDKSVLVQASGPVTVTAVSYQSFTTDAALVFPTPALGTSYRAQGYRGLPGFVDFYKSELLIVATQDGTEVTIVPSVLTSGGHPAGVPFNVSLNAGETYQLQGALASLDITGTTVIGTEQSGPCRPFAVFSGSMCANVPVGCPACDHIYEQMVPTDKWGTSFHTIAFGNTTQHTYRVMAHQPNTQVSVNNGAPITLNAGGLYEINAASAPVCITATLPVSVVQLMEGFNCANKGDPAMIELVPDERTSTSATFRVPSSPQLTQHSISVLVSTASIAQFQIDGVAPNSALFQPYTSCPGWSQASFIVPVGDHTLTSTAGFIAYASGTGTGESYAFAINSVEVADTPPPAVICSADPITLSVTEPAINGEWTLASAPGNVLATGTSYTFTPTVNGTYVFNGELPVSGCPVHHEWQVGVPTQPILDVTANGLPSAQVCQYNGVQLNAVPPPDPAVFDLTWTPAGNLSDASIHNPVAYPSSNTWYKLAVSSPVGCGSVADSVFVQVLPSDIVGVKATASDSAICLGQSITLSAQAERVLSADPLDNTVSALWASVQGGALSNLCGAVSGSALRFDAAGNRRATTVPLNLLNAARTRFALRIGAGAAPCDDAEPGDDVLLQYSLDGSVWTTFFTLNEAAYPVWSELSVAIPVVAQTASTRLRWSQVANSGAGTDVWALDNVVITRYDNAGIAFTWSPNNGVTNPSSASTAATPNSTTNFQVSAQNPGGCAYTAQVPVTVAPAFGLQVSDDTTVCTPGIPVQLLATPSSGSGITYAWTPGNGSLNNTSSPSPIATPTTTTSYTVTATTDIGCTDNENITVTVGQLQSVAVAASDTQLCQGEQTQLTATVTGTLPWTLNWTPNNGTLGSTTAPTTTASPTQTTTYTATVTETASGCVRSGAVTIQMAPVYTADAGPDVTLCTTLGHVLNVDHNVQQATIVWTNASLLNDATIQSPSLLFDTTATFVVTITDPLGCSVSDQVSVTDPFDLLITPINIDACDGETITLDAQFPGCEYDWNTGEDTQTLLVSASGTYICTITDPQGCQAVKTYFVDLNALPTVELGDDLSLCGASSYTLNANSAGNSVLWTTEETTQQITVSTSGWYGVQVTTPQGCQAEDSVQIAFNPLPIDVLQDVTACISSLPVLDAGNPGCQYLWSTSSVDQTIEAGSSGTYTVQITTPANCAATFDAVVTLMPEVHINLGNDTTICANSPINLDAGVPGLDYLWNTSATTQTISPTTTGVYSVNATNGYCSGADTLLLTVQPVPQDVLVDVTSCIDVPVVLDAGNPGCSYAWSTGGNQQTTVVTASGTVSVLVTDQAGCSNTFDAVVQFVGYPIVDLGPDSVLCEGDLLELDAANPGATFSWNTGQSTSSIVVAGSGDYVVAVSNGYCTTTDSVRVVFNPRPSRIPTHDFFTCLDEDPHYVIISAGNQGAAYNWSSGEDTQVILAGAYGWYYVDITNQFDCSLRDSASVTEFCPPSLYVPNTFTPNGDGTNDVWMVSGKNIGHFDLNVFDRWGNVIFHSEHPDHGWDGQINGQPAPNDVYVWRMEYRFIEKVEGDQGVNKKQLGHVTIMR